VDRIGITQQKQLSF